MGERIAVRIGFFALSMCNGGAERVAAQLTRLWAQLGHQIVLFTAVAATERDFAHTCEIRDIVDYNELDERSLRTMCARHRLNILIFNDGINWPTFPRYFAAAKSIPNIRTYIIIHHTANNWLYGTNNTQELFRGALIAQADALICVDRIWALWWKHRGAKSVFIPNPCAIASSSVEGEVLLVDSVEQAAHMMSGARKILWVGRLCDKLKRPELAVDVFAKVLETTPEASLTMLGTISSRLERSLKRRLMMHLEHASNGRLVFPGFVANVNEYLECADVHLFTSVTEVTVPQVVREAQAAGLKTVAFDAPFLRGVRNRESDECIREKWGRLLDGNGVGCDFASETDYQNLMDEIAISQRYFASCHLPELLSWRRWRMRMNPVYLFSRAYDKFISHISR